MTQTIGHKISVCLLTYNHVDIIESTIQSILNQTIDGYEVIISDDCSTDGTWEKILQMASMDTRIRPIQTPHNMGMPGNANFAVAHSDRPYIALLHHDDLYRNDLLAKWAALLERHPDVAFVFNPYGAYQSDLIHSEAIPSGRVDGRWLLEKYLFPRWGCAVRGTAMIRRSAWQQVGGMREQFGLLADVDLWMRLSMHYAVGYVPEPIIVVRQQRPASYPDEYWGQWSWRRQRYLYEIHAANRQDYLDRSTLRGRIRWSIFRWRVSLETAKWLSYAVVRKKLGMIETSADSVTACDLVWLRIFRRGLQLVIRLPFVASALSARRG
jgi:glycosyltransferase involved in cell wall biosynthesis